MLGYKKIFLFVLLSFYTGVFQPSVASPEYYSALPPSAQFIAETIAGVYGADLPYVEAFVSEAIMLEKRSGLPAAAVVGIAMLESAGFTSRLFEKSRNPFGIKASQPWNGPIYMHWQYDEIAPFRVYGSAKEAVRDFSTFVSNRRWFADACACQAIDYYCFIDGLGCNNGEPGYSTDPMWPVKVKRLIDRFELYQLSNIYYSGRY